MEQDEILQMNMIDSEASQLNQQLQLIEQNKVELEELKASLEGIEEGEKEILVNLGKKIYLPVNIKDKNLRVYIGDNNFIDKSIPDTKKIIDDQLNKLDNAVLDINKRLHVLQSEIESLMGNIENKNKSK